MYLSHCEIIEDFEAQIRKSGREPGDWLVGTAKDAGGPFFQQHRAVDLGDALPTARPTPRPQRIGRQPPGFRSRPHP